MGINQCMLFLPVETLQLIAEPCKIQAYMLYKISCH